MQKIYIFLICLFSTVAAFSQQAETVYLWESPSGAVNQSGGKIVQHNGLSVSRINYRSSGYYTIQLCGKKENLSDEDNTINSVYFTITLADGTTFKSGDNIEITAMRNNDNGGKSNIHFLYSNSTVVDDTNTWANLGQMHEMTFSGGVEAKGSASDISADDAGTEPIGGFSLEPSTNTFTVPAEADGSSTLSLTRNESECMLYITKISVSRDTSAGINDIKCSLVQGSEDTYNLAGQRINSNTHGIIIRKGRKTINH